VQVNLALAYSVMVYGSNARYYAVILSVMTQRHQRTQSFDAIDIEISGYIHVNTVEHVTSGLLQLHWSPVRTLAHAIQIMCSDALDTYGEMPNLPERHY